MENNTWVMAPNKNGVMKLGRFQQSNQRKYKIKFARNEINYVLRKDIQDPLEFFLENWPSEAEIRDPKMGPEATKKALFSISKIPNNHFSDPQKHFKVVIEIFKKAKRQIKRDLQRTTHQKITQLLHRKLSRKTRKKEGKRKAHVHNKSLKQPLLPPSNTSNKQDFHNINLSGGKRKKTYRR